jgi:hypothetical protein
MAGETTAGLPHSGALEIELPSSLPMGDEGPHEPTFERALETDSLQGVLSPALVGAAMGKMVMTESLRADEHTLRTCDFDAPAGPLEVSASEWDGKSVWIGAIPNHGVCRKGGAGDNSPSATAASARASTGIFLKLYRLTDALQSLLDGFGEGLDERDGMTTVCLHASNSWALVTYKRREDAEALISAAGDGDGIRMPPSSELGEGQTGTVLLTKRAIDADEAKHQLEEDALVAKEKHDMVVLAVSRIQSWVKRSGKELSELFAKIDVDGSGDFDVQEFRAGMLSIGLTFTDDVINALMSFMDSDGGGMHSK